MTALPRWLALLATLCVVAHGQNINLAIVNQEPFHFEVLAGFMHLASSTPGLDLTAVYLQRWRQVNATYRVVADFGFSGLVSEQQRPLLVDLPARLARHDVLVFISPEYNVTWVEQMVREAEPRHVIHVIHNADTTLLPQLVAVHSDVKILTLAPHVLRYLVKRSPASKALAHHPALKTATWMLPTMPFRPKQPCPAGQGHTCLSGFAIQGKINRYKRNYTHVFEQLALARQRCGNGTCADVDGERRLVLHLVGATWTRLYVPQHLKPWVHRKSYLTFEVFYELIHHAVALVPAVGSSSYYDRKFSSTIITSLVTGTPIMTDPALLAPYSRFLNASHVLLQQPGEGLAACMLRALRSPELQAATRGHLAALQGRLNRDAGNKLVRIISGGSIGRRQRVMARV